MLDYKSIFFSYLITLLIGLVVGTFIFRSSSFPITGFVCLMSLPYLIINVLIHRKPITYWKSQIFHLALAAASAFVIFCVNDPFVPFFIVGPYFIVGVLVQGVFAYRNREIIPKVDSENE